MNTGNLAEAARRFKEARQLAQDIGSPRMEGWVLLHLPTNTVFEMKFQRGAPVGR